MKARIGYLPDARTEAAYSFVMKLWAVFFVSPACSHWWLCLVCLWFRGGIGE